MKMQKLAADRVIAGTMTKTAYHDLELMTGFRYNPHGVLQSPRLRALFDPLDVVTYDWVHSALQGGVLTAEVEAMLMATGVSRGELQSFLQSSKWEYPHHSTAKARALHRIFDFRRVSADDPQKIRATCSELLGVYGLLRFFFELKLGRLPEHETQLQSFNAACEVIDVLLHFKHGLAAPADAAAELDTALQRHLELHLAAYGDLHLKPKHHWMLDVPEQLRRDGVVLDAFVIERTHLRVKALAEKIKNTVAYENSVLSGLLTVFLQSGEEVCGCRLLGRVQDLPGFAPRVIVADRLQVFAVEISVSDVVLCGESAGIVQACAMQSGELFLFVAPLRRQDRLTLHCSVCVRTLQLEVWLATEVVHALSWQQRPDGSMLVLQR